MRPLAIIAFLWSLGVLLTGCLPWVGVGFVKEGPAGTTSRGVLVGGGHLPREGEHYRVYRGGDRRYGVSSLTRAIVRASERVAADHPGAVLLVGDISQEGGGFIGGHRSHRSGRDADFGFYVTDLEGRDAEGHPLMRFDRFGIGAREKDAYRFDAARNWAFVEALLTDEEIQVQWIFVSRGLKAFLMEWALENGRPLEIVERSASVLSQPGDSAPHDDHFHVRIYCPKDASGGFCVNTGPLWPWIRRDASPGAPFTRDELLELAFENLS